MESGLVANLAVASIFYLDINPQELSWAQNDFLCIPKHTTIEMKALLYEEPPKWEMFSFSNLLVRVGLL